MPLSDFALAPRKLICVCGIAAGVPRRGEITTPAAPAGAHAIEQQVPATAVSAAAAVRVRGVMCGLAPVRSSVRPITAARVILSGHNLRAPRWAQSCAVGVSALE